MRVEAVDWWIGNGLDEAEGDKEIKHVFNFLTAVRACVIG